MEGETREYGLNETEEGKAVAVASRSCLPWGSCNMICLNNVLYFSAKVRGINFTGNEEGIVFTLEVNAIIANSLRALHDYPFKAHVLKSQAVRRVPMQMSGRTALSGVTSKVFPEKRVVIRSSATRNQTGIYFHLYEIYVWKYPSEAARIEMCARATFFFSDISYRFSSHLEDIIIANPACSTRGPQSWFYGDILPYDNSYAPTKIVPSDRTTSRYSPAQETIKNYKLTLTDSWNMAQTRIAMIRNTTVNFIFICKQMRKDLNNSVARQAKDSIPDSATSARFFSLTSSQEDKRNIKNLELRFNIYLV
ncbi:hypothetical protein EAG_03045 [Camponotus floridanus]|uniref:Uncharacterized protein n=1 Tax=Camponotus floridanus TaxID=104421 RepID=E2ANV1_CAMFO|nr:hypothetical protein EAG_03045 [Camponotus floridanus]